MPALIEAPPHPLSFADLARISRQLADDVGRLPLRTEGFTVDDYLSLDGNYLVEFVDGRLQVLPMPDTVHQALTVELLQRVRAHAATDPLARAVQAPFRVYLTPTLYREPDVAFMLGRHSARRTRDRWDGADLAIEIVSDSNRGHDERTKRREYAAAGVPEYWIVDPEDRTVHVLTLPNAADQYVSHGQFGPGQVATSVLLPGFAVDVTELFAAAERQA